MLTSEYLTSSVDNSLQSVHQVPKCKFKLTATFPQHFTAEVFIQWMFHSWQNWLHPLMVVLLRTGHCAWPGDCRSHNNQRAQHHAGESNLLDWCCIGNMCFSSTGAQWLQCSSCFKMHWVYFPVLLWLHLPDCWPLPPRIAFCKMHTILAWKNIAIALFLLGLCPGTSSRLALWQCLHPKDFNIQERGLLSSLPRWLGMSFKCCHSRFWQMNTIKITYTTWISLMCHALPVQVQAFQRCYHRD